MQGNALDAMCGHAGQDCLRVVARGHGTTYIDTLARNLCHGVGPASPTRRGGDKLGAKYDRIRS
jgi:hypothetical protein